MTASRYAGRKDVEAQVADWDDNFLQCRTYGHPWQPSRATLNRRGFWSIVEFCPRCTSQRRYEMSTSGTVFGHPSIEYAEGYLSHGLGRIAGDAKGAVRLATVNRIFEVKRLSAKESMAAQPHSKYTRDALSDATSPDQQKEAS